MTDAPAPLTLSDLAGVWAASMASLAEDLPPLEKLRWLFLNDAEFHALAVMIEPYWAHVYRVTALQEAHDVCAANFDGAEAIRKYARERYAINLRDGY